MPTTTGQVKGFDQFQLKVGDGNIDLSNTGAGAFVCLLLTNSYTEDLADVFISDLSGEVVGNGYARESLTNVAWTTASGTAKFTADPIVFTASGGSIVARRYVVAYDNGAADSASEVMFVGLLNNADADVTVEDGGTLTINPHATNGFFTCPFTDAT